jgi:L-lactate utilization protein LutB
MTSFPEAARTELANVQLRTNLRNATDTIRAKRAAVVAEVPDWEELREAGRALKADILVRLDEYLLQFEANFQAAGGIVHWARDADEANAIVVGVARSHGAEEVVKVKSLTTDEIRLNDALAAAGIHALETDFAELILQLDGDWPSHILVPAIHRNRSEIRDLFARTIAPAIGSCASAFSRPASASAERTSPLPRPARSASSNPRETAACARPCRRCSSRCSASRSSCPASRTCRSSSSSCRARPPASG